MKQLLLIILTFSFSLAYGAPVSLPFNFESGSIVNGDFLNFGGGTATVIPNPVSGGINTSATVGRMVRNGGQPFAGAYLTTPANVDFSVNPIICMKVYTTAPVGTRIALKMEGCGGGCFREIDAFTTVSGAWETLCYDFTGEPTNYNRVVFLFDLGNVGDGSPTSTFLFDDVEQRSEIPLTLTPGSQYFCPNAALSLTFPGSGTYDWFSDPAGTILVQAASSTYNTPVLTGSTSYYVQDMTPTAFPATDVGPTNKGSSNPQGTTASTFFTSNLDNGFWYSADIVEKIVGGGPPPYTCQYSVTAVNITQGTSRNLTWNHNGACDNCQFTYNFPTPLPIFLNDQLELRVDVSGDVGCFISSHHSGGDVITTFPTTTTEGALTFTSHTPVANNWMGFDYRVSGDLVDQTKFQVNAIDDCARALPIELVEFSVEDNKGDALLNWTTASETNNDYFLVKRSQNGIEFETLGIVQGQGNSTTETAYSYTDKAPLNGLSYYQLEQVDFDEISSLSRLVSYEKTGISSTIFIYPNPTNGSFTVRANQEESAELEIKIQDMTGRVIGSFNHVAGLGASEIQLDVKDYPTGIYSVIVQQKHATRVFKLVKK